MLSIARRGSWIKLSARFLSSNTVVFKQSSKIRKAQLLKLWNDNNYNSNEGIVSSLLGEAVTLHDQQLSLLIASRLSEFGPSSIKDVFLTIDCFDSCGNSARAVEQFSKLSSDDALQYIIEHSDVAWSPELAAVALQTYKAAVQSDSTVLNNVLLGNGVLRLYEVLKDLQVNDIEKAVELLSYLRDNGSVIQFRSYEALMLAANNTKCHDIAESIYSDFRKQNSDSLIAGIETQRMNTLLRKRKFKDCLSVYDSLITNGIPLTERIVCYAVDSCNSLLYLESAIKILNKWYEGGGVMTWSVCRSTLRLAITIDNMILNKSTPQLPPADIYMDGFTPKVEVLSSTSEKGSGDTKKVAGLSKELQHALDSVSFDLPSDFENPFMERSSVESVEYVHNAEQLFTAKEDKRTVKTPQFNSREERLDFFKQYLVRRVIGRILQSQDMSTRRHPIEGRVPDDVLMMCVGQIVLQGQLDSLLNHLQHDDEDGQLSPLVNSLFISAPIQLLNQKTSWREFSALIERMRSYSDVLPADTQVAALTRYHLLLLKSNQKDRAMKLMFDIVPYFKENAEMLNVFAEILSRSDCNHVVSITKRLQKRGYSLNEKYLISSLQTCRNVEDMSRVIAAWMPCDVPVFRENKHGDKIEKKHVASDELCLAISRVLRYQQQHADVFIGYLLILFQFSKAQAELIRHGRLGPKPERKTDNQMNKKMNKNNNNNSRDRNKATAQRSFDPFERDFD